MGGLEYPKVHGPGANVHDDIWFVAHQRHGLVTFTGVEVDPDKLVFFPLHYVTTHWTLVLLYCLIVKTKLIVEYIR